MDCNSHELTVQVLSWAYEHSIKYGMDDLCFEIEAKFEGAKVHPEFYRGFSILVRRLQLLSRAERTPENLESLGCLLEDMLRIPTFQHHHRLYSGLIRLHVTTKLLTLHKRKHDYNTILKHFPLFNWEQIKKDFCLYDESLKDTFKSLVDSGHSTIRRDFSWSRTSLILNEEFLSESTKFLRSKVPKLLSSLQRVFPRTALDRLAADEDHCRHLSENGVGAYQVLIRSLDDVDGMRKFTRESVKKVVRSLSLKRRPPVVNLDESGTSKSCFSDSLHPLTVTLDDSSTSKSRQSDSSHTPEIIRVEDRDTGSSSSPPSVKLARPSNEGSSAPRAKRMKSGSEDEGLCHSEGVIGRMKLPLVVVKRNYVYSDGVKWPKREAELHTVSSRDNDDSEGNDTTAIGGKRKAPCAEKENNLLESDCNRALTDSRGLDSTLRKGKEDSSANPRRFHSLQTSSEDTSSILEQPASQYFVKDGKYNMRNVIAPDFVVVSGRKWPYQKSRQFHPLKVQGYDPKDPIMRGDSEGMGNFNVLKKNLRNLDREHFMRIPGASSKSIKIKVGSRETVVRNLNLRPLNFARYSGHCASEYLGMDNLPEGAMGERELQNLISKLESVLEVLKEKLSKMSAGSVRKQQGTLNASGTRRGTMRERTCDSAVLGQSSEKSSEQPSKHSSEQSIAAGKSVTESQGSSTGISSNTSQETESCISSSSENCEHAFNLNKSVLEVKRRRRGSVQEQLSCVSSQLTRAISNLMLESTDTDTASHVDVGEPKVVPPEMSGNEESVPETLQDNETFLTAAESVNNTFVTAFN